jgi:hypothetical protein
MTPKQKFKFLRGVRMYIQSYEEFIDKMQEAIIDESEEKDNMFNKEFVVDKTEKTTSSVKVIIGELNNLSQSLTKRFMKVAGSSFAEFLKPFIGEKIVVPFGKNAGKEYTVESLLKEAESDITFMDRWLQSMADSSDILLQGFDAAVKKANNDTRLEVIDRLNKIHAWREKVEKLGINNFDWAFETDNEGNKSGNYISKINYAQFQKDFKRIS